MASKAVASLGCKGAEAKGSIRYVAIDGIAAGRREAEPSRTTTAGTERTYLEAPKPPSGLIQHQRPKPRHSHRLHRLRLVPHSLLKWHGSIRNSVK
ncbi:hypothetical protein COCNU_scaffold008027G000030 [Cocos nucifera]|nr:hypothetical protein [Cocos nucifera]